jgi:hypothetical protein
MASVLMVIVILFFLCHSSRIIVNFYEALQVRFTFYSKRSSSIFHS